MFGLIYYCAQTGLANGSSTERERIDIGGGIQDERRSDSELFATPLGNGALGGSGGSGVDIFIESGDCDLEFGDDSGG